MYKLHQRVLLHSILTMLIMMNVASNVKVLPLPAEKTPLEQLSRPILNMILEYVEIHTGFEFIRLTPGFYATLRRPLTKVAYAQYYSFLMIKSPPPSLPRYARFLHIPLDPTVPFPSPPLLFIPPAPLYLIERPHTITILEEKIVPTLEHHWMNDYDRMEINRVTTCQIKKRSLWPWLPLSYDPTRAMLRLYPRLATPGSGFRQYVRLPFLLTFTDVAGATLRTEHTMTWLALQWQYCTHAFTISRITWVSQDWIIQTFIHEDGGVYTITVTNNNGMPLGTFQARDHGHSYTLIDGANMAPDVYPYTNIQAFYYPTTPQLFLRQDTNIEIPKKKFTNGCCNIV